MEREGWICPKCQQGVRPDVERCPCSEYSLFKSIPIGAPWRPGDPAPPPRDCPCPPFAACGNVACPRLPKITCAVGIPLTGDHAMGKVQ